MGSEDAGPSCQDIPQHKLPGCMLQRPDCGKWETLRDTGTDILQGAAAARVPVGAAAEPLPWAPDAVRSGAVLQGRPRDAPSRDRAEPS